MNKTTNDSITVTLDVTPSSTNALGWTRACFHITTSGDIPDGATLTIIGFFRIATGETFIEPYDTPFLSPVVWPLIQNGNIKQIPCIYSETYQIIMRQGDAVRARASLSNAPGVEVLTPWTTIE